MDVEEKIIFIVDDDENIGEVLKNMLVNENYRVESFTSGKKAMEHSIAETPRILLLDYFLPGENTEEIISYFKNKSGKEVKVLLMSASMNALRAVKELPVNEFISKPFQRETLLRVISRNIN
jgi:DNA-binding NtrC family response regulator